MSDLEKITYLPSEMAEEIRGLKEYIGSGNGGGTNLDEIAFGEMTEEELRENLTNPGSTNPKHYENIAEAIATLHNGPDIRAFDIFIEKTIYQAGDYNAYDDNAYGYSTVHVAIGSGGGGTIGPREYVERTATQIECSDASYVAPYAFTNYEALIAASFPSCTSVGAEAFSGCTNLVRVEIPECTYIDRLAFNDCINLSEASFPLCSTVRAGVFSNCGNLENLYLPVCSSIGSEAFRNCWALTVASFSLCSYLEESVFFNCSSLVSAYFPICYSISGDAFLSCSSLSDILFPVCKNIGENAFARCGALSEVSFSQCQVIDIGAFISCSGLTAVTFPNCRRIGSFAFSRCSHLESVYLPGSTVCTLASKTAFADTPLSNLELVGTYGSIFVPSSLYSRYIVASNWSFYSSRFAFFEGINVQLNASTLSFSGSFVEIDGDRVKITDPDVCIDNDQIMITSI